MAIPFQPPPPDEYSLRRLHELVEELYVLIVCHLLDNEQAIEPPTEPQRRRGASCTDDQKNSPGNLKRDGGDSDSDPDSCAAATIATSADSVLAEVADLVQSQNRRHPGELLTPKRIADSREDIPRPSSTGSGAPNPSRCSCQSGRSRGWRNAQGDFPIISAAYSPDVQSRERNSHTTQKRYGVASLVSVFRSSRLAASVLATITACYIGYHLLCTTNILNFAYLR